MKRIARSVFSCLFVLLLPLSLPSEPEKLSKSGTLRAEDIKNYDVPIHQQSKPWLVEEFGPGKKYPVNLSKVTKNIVWQVHEGIRTKELEPIDGLIRTFWYTHIKPVFARADGLSQDSDQSEILSEALVELVRDRDLMRYKDFGFFDNNEGNREIGKNWNIMLVGEKHGKYAVLRRIARELECTVVTLGGQPSLLSMEYLVDEYKAKGVDLRSNIYVIFVVDYDPAGWVIRDSVEKDLKFYGMSNLKPIDLIVPEILTKEELELALFPLKEKQKTLNENWLKETGGVNGKLMGFESDSVPFNRLKQKIVEAATPNIKKENRIAATGTQP